MGAAETGNPRASPAAMPPAALAAALTRVSGRPITEAMITADVRAGAPTNRDGTINVMHYGAWLTKEVTARASGPAQTATD